MHRLFLVEFGLKRKLKNLCLVIFEMTNYSHFCVKRSSAH